MVGLKIPLTLFRRVTKFHVQEIVIATDTGVYLFQSAEGLWLSRRLCLGLCDGRTTMSRTLRLICILTSRLLLLLLIEKSVCVAILK